MNLGIHDQMFLQNGTGAIFCEDVIIGYLKTEVILCIRNGEFAEPATGAGAHTSHVPIGGFGDVGIDIVTE